MMKLAPEQFARAAKFLREQARPLERALFRFHFEGGARENALRELAAFQNPDGGFGHASEPDLRTPDSSAIATSHRLQLLRELLAGSGTAFRSATDLAPGGSGSTAATMVCGAMEYLRTTRDRTNHVWPIIPPSANNAPHAPWWTTKDLAQSWRGFRANPTAEITGYFFQFGTAADESLRQAALRHTLDFLAAQPPDMHELLCYVRLAEMVPLPVTAQQTITDRVLATTERDPAQWPKYGLRPLTVVKSPASPYCAALREAVEANLDFLITEQNADGSWHPTWSWGNAFPETWPVAKRDWQGVLTLDALKVLRAFGRISD
jgi:hypothetical protein